MHSTICGWVHIAFHYIRRDLQPSRRPTMMQINTLAMITYTIAQVFNVLHFENSLFSDRKYGGLRM